MNMYWVYDLPNFVFGLISISSFILFGLVGLSLTRRWVRRLHQVDHSHNDIVSYYLAAVTVFYGITLGLVAVGTWNTYSEVETKVDREAQIAASLYRDVSAYPGPFGKALTGDLKSYLHEVITVSWPLQRKGIVPTGSGVYLDAFQADMLSFEPTTPGQQILHAEAYKQFNLLVEARRSRLNSVTASIPTSLWLLVIIGALVSITVTFFFDTPSFSMHVVMTCLMSGLLGLIIFLVGTLDNPFRGKVSVGPLPLIRLYQLIEKK
jgi:hypothetical protein